MVFDYKKEYKEFYLPPAKPGIVEIPTMYFVAVRGQGDPNEPDGEYAASVSALYAISYTLKMSKKGSRQIEGYFDYVVPPLEGLWWQDKVKGVDYSRKQDFRWISLIRLPDFITADDFEWAQSEAEMKKKLDLSKAEFFTYDEGLCVQCLHKGPFDDEPATVQMMDAYARDEGYHLDFSDTRFHHEIYLSDPRKSAPANLKTVIRHPLKK